MRRCVLIDNRVLSYDRILDLENKVAHALRENYPNAELFWSVFSRIWTEYGYLSATI